MAPRRLRTSVGTVIAWARREFSVGTYQKDPLSNSEQLSSEHRRWQVRLSARSVKERATVVVVLGSVLLGGCGAQRTSLPTSTATWAAQTGVVAYERSLNADIVQLGLDTRRAQWGQAQLDCVALGTDASRIEGTLPAPDTSLSYQLEDAYRVDTAFATACIRAKGHPSAAAWALLSKGKAHMQKATARFDGLKGH